jgi:hypothetical protein
MAGFDTACALPERSRDSSLCALVATHTPQPTEPLNMELDVPAFSAAAATPTSAAAALAVPAVPAAAATAGQSSISMAIMSIDVNPATLTNRCAYELCFAMCSCLTTNCCHSCANDCFWGSCMRALPAPAEQGQACAPAWRRPCMPSAMQASKARDR